MKYISILIVAIGLVSCTPDEDKYKNEAGEVDGKIVYQHECMICHGEDGTEGNSGAANLKNSLLEPEDQAEVVVNGRGDMQPFDYLTEEEVNAVVNYIQTLKK